MMGYAARTGLWPSLAIHPVSQTSPGENARMIAQELIRYTREQRKAQLAR